MINLQLIEQHKLETDPFHWAFIKNLYSPADAKSLVATYPRDSFKTVAGYDGEKGYEYEARSLIGMGAKMPSHGHC